MKKKIFLFVMLMIMINGRIAKGSLEEGVHILDTGQSDCIFINTKGTKGLIDCGWYEDREYICKYLNRQKVEYLDFIILTHYHDDHIGDVSALVKEFKVKNIFLPNYRSANGQNLIKELKNNKKDFKFIEKGWRYKGADTDLQLIPPINLDKKNENNNSVLLYGKIDGLTYLLSGDLENEQEKLMLQHNLIPEADILKVPHHGIDTSSTREFLGKVKPKVAVVSTNGYESPSNLVMDRLRGTGCNIYTTHKNGTIIIKRGEDGFGIDVKTVVK